MDQKTINQFRVERKGRCDFVVVEGYHALKHAFRFGAEISAVYMLDAVDDQIFGETVRDEDFENFLQEKAHNIDEEDFAKLTLGATRTGIIARVRRLDFSLEDIAARDQRIVVLEEPRDLSNVGAVIRVCAARGNTSLMITGDVSPWHTHAVRGGAGLQWAVPIVQTTIEDVLSLALHKINPRKIFACTDEGLNMYEKKLPRDAVLIFGTEREGITKDVRNQAYCKIGIPMQEGVSSMNLATSVSAVLFGCRF